MTILVNARVSYVCMFFPEPSHASLPMKPRFDVLAGDRDINVGLYMLSHS